MSELRHTSGRRHGHRNANVVGHLRVLSVDEHEQLLDDLAEAEHRVDSELDARDRFEDAA